MRPECLELQSIRRISLKKVRVHEDAYCKEPILSKAHLDSQMKKMFKEDMREYDELRPVQTISSLRRHKESHIDAQRVQKLVTPKELEIVADGVEYIPDFANQEELKETVKNLMKDVKKFEKEKAKKKSLGKALTELLQEAAEI